MLYDLLKDRAAVNILKALYDNETTRKSYAMRMAEVQRQFPWWTGIPASTQRLISSGLANADAVGNDAVLTITQKGKQFIEVFDQLLVLSNGTKLVKQNTGASITYQLLPIERQILAAVQKVGEQNGKGTVSLQAISRALYPAEQPKRKVAALDRNVAQLEELGFVHVEKIGRNTLVRLREKGKKTIHTEKGM